MLKNPKTRAKKPSITAQELCPPASPACINALDLASAVTSYTPRTLTVQDIPDIPVYNREKNRIQRFSRIASVPAYSNGASEPEEIGPVEKRVVTCQPLAKCSPINHGLPVLPGSMHELARDLQPPFIPDSLQKNGPAQCSSRELSPNKSSSFMPLAKFASNQSKHDSIPEYSDASSVTFSVNSTKSPAYKRNSTFDSPYHQRSFSSNSTSTGPSNISQVDLSYELDNNSFYEYYFNKSYFEDTDSLFSYVGETPKAPPKTSRRVVSEIQQPTYTKPPPIKFPNEVCLDICADYEKSRFMIPKDYQVRPQGRTVTPNFSAESKHKSLPMIPEPKARFCQKISSGTKNKFSRIFSK